MRSTLIPGLSAIVPEGWVDITDEEEGGPLTLAKEIDGVGALQFSAAFYSSGKPPNIDHTSVSEIVERLFLQHELSPTLDEVPTVQDSYVAVGGVAESDDLILGIWGVSDRTNFVLVTYTNLTPADLKSAEELGEALVVAASIQFE